MKKMLILLLLVLAPTAGADTVELPRYTTPCDEVRPIVGTVVAVSGPASSLRTGCAPAALGCGSAIYAGDHVTTGPGASLGIQTGASYVQVAGGSTIVMSGGGAAGSEIAVESGQVRVVDTDDDELGAPDRVVAGGQSTSVPADGDVVASAAVGGGPAICSLAGPIDVTGAGGAAPDACVPAVSAGPGAGSAPGGISIADVARCTQLADLTPTEVATGPLNSFALGPPVIPPPPYCQNGTCGRNLTPPAPPPHSPFPLVEQPAGFEPPP